MNTMNGIDVSEFDGNLKIQNLLNIDFVIVKLTQGISYSNPFAEKQIEKTLKTKKCLGLYHKINGSGALNEMIHFVAALSNYRGKAIPIIQWVQENNTAWGNPYYLQQCLENFIRLTKVRPIIYCNRYNFPWDLCKKFKCGSWVAQYETNRPTDIQNNPWNEESCRCDIRQYTSNLRFPQYSRSVGGDKSYISRSRWEKWAKTYSIKSQKKLLSTKEISKKILAGELGHDPNLFNRLEAEGYDIEKIRRELGYKSTPIRIEKGLYLLKEDVSVHTGPGRGYRTKIRSELTKDGRAHSNANGTICEGTSVKVLEVKDVKPDEIWVRIPSGWICAYKNSNTKIRPVYYTFT